MILMVQKWVCPVCSNETNYGSLLAINTKISVSCWHCDWSAIPEAVPAMLTALKGEALEKNAPTTQKAKGICALQKSDLGSTISIYGLMKVAPGAQAPKHVLGLLAEGYPPIFARPCPPLPEHGFVESRVVKTVEEIEKLREETFAANPDSEIIFTGLVDAALNAVWTPHMLAIGPGHDGATSGKGAISIPLAGVVPTGMTAGLLKMAGLNQDSGPFIEAVKGKNECSKWLLTQLRAGPKEACGLDFIPTKRVCEKVRKTNGEDLLEWAKVVKTLAAEPGTFVYHPGGTVVDHYSVHCRCNNVPIYITKEPVVGETYAPTKEVIPHDPNAMALGIAAGDLLKNDASHNDQILLALLALHNSDAMRGDASFWIGVGATVVTKLGLAALEGEGRHAHSCFAGMKHKPDIYAFYNAKTLSYARARVSRISQLLYWGFGDPKLPHGYGGPKWALCGAALCPLFNVMRRVVLERSSESATELISALNLAINQAHNGGWWLNKFADGTAYTEVPKADLGYVLKAATAAYSVHQKRDQAAGYLERLAKQMEKWPTETVVGPLKWRKVRLEIGMGCFNLHLKAATLPKEQIVQLPVTPAIMKSIEASIGSIKIEPGKVDFVHKEGQVVNVWHENPLVAKAQLG